LLAFYIRVRKRLHEYVRLAQDLASGGLLSVAAFRVRPSIGRATDTAIVHARRSGPQMPSGPDSQGTAKAGNQRAVLLGHSWGTLVAIALALRHPESVRILVLASGYYYPGPRVDVIALSGRPYR
jgi:pimeloyl-ACP methyl ester carboxylesterase